MKIYKHLSLEERKKLYLMKIDEVSVKTMARALNRHRSTIRRELSRNTDVEPVGYLPDMANILAKERRASYKLKVEKHPELKDLIVNKLKDGWSPEAIAGRMKQQASPLRISCETIYQFIYSKEGKKSGLFKYLLKARPRRGLIFDRRPRSSIIKDRVSIHDRPEHVATRSEFGHLEGDLTFFTGNKSMNIGVVVERKTRFTQLVVNQSKHTAVVMKGMFNKIAQLPAIARKSMTLDNGLEFARHTVLRRFMNMKTYFCDKHSPWQKGQVEQMNVMLHRYLPKNSNLKEIAHEQIESIQHKLNNLPRRCLGFKTPAEAFYEQLLEFGALQT